MPIVLNGYIFMFGNFTEMFVRSSSLFGGVFLSAFYKYATLVLTVRNTL